MLEKFLLWKKWKGPWALEKAAPELSVVESPSPEGFKNCVDVTSGRGSVVALAVLGEWLYLMI